MAVTWEPLVRLISNLEKAHPRVPHNIPGKFQWDRTSGCRETVVADTHTDTQAGSRHGWSLHNCILVIQFLTDRAEYFFIFFCTIDVTILLLLRLVWHHNRRCGPEYVPFQGLILIGQAVPKLRSFICQPMSRHGAMTSRMTSQLMFIYLFIFISFARLKLARNIAGDPRMCLFKVWY